MKRKWPMWRKRQRNYVWTPDRFNKRKRRLEKLAKEEISKSRIA